MSLRNNEMKSKAYKNKQNLIRRKMETLKDAKNIFRLCIIFMRWMRKVAS